MKFPFAKCALVIAGVVVTSPGADVGPPTDAPSVGGAVAATSMTHVPLWFEENRGQTDPDVAFVARTADGTLYLARHEVVVAARGASKTGVLRLQFGDDAATPRVLGVEPLEGRVNYFLGGDSTKWLSDVPTFGRVRYAGIAAGVDAEFHGGSGGRPEFDLVVAPGADLAAASLRLEGADTAVVDDSGDLRLTTRAGALTLTRPVAWQDSDHGRRAIECRFDSPVRADGGAFVVAFTADRRDPALPLVVDPSIVFATYLGGSGSAATGLGNDAGQAIAVDSSGFAYVAGRTDAIDFPGAAAGVSGAFVAKLKADGSGVVYTTFLGASPETIAVDGGGAAYVAGSVFVSGLATTGAAQATLGGGGDAFVAKLAAGTGTLSYFTYLGGVGFDDAHAVAVDGSGVVYVAGETQSTSGLATAGVAQPSNGGGFSDGFVAKLNAAGTSFTYVTYVGGGGNDVAEAVAFDNSGNAYAAGYTASSDFPVAPASPLQQFRNGGTADAFVTKIDSAGASFVYSTYLGGEDTDSATALRVDASTGAAYVAGPTRSSDRIAFNAFPITGGAAQTVQGGGSDAFVAKIAAAGTSLVYSTYLGGVGDESVTGLAIDGSGNAYVTGTAPAGFPTHAAFQSVFGGSSNGSDGDAYLAKLNATGGAFTFATYLGGSGGEIGAGVAVDAGAAAYVTGSTGSPNFPTSHAFQAAFAGGQSDAFVTKFDAAGASLTWSTYLGGRAPRGGSDSASAVVVDAQRRPVVVGVTAALDFPKQGAFQSASGSVSTATPRDGFVAKFASTGDALVFATYLGGSDNDYCAAVALTTTNEIVVAGATSSADFPLKNAFQPTIGGGQDAFVTKLNASGSALVFSTYFGAASFDYAQAVAVASDDSVVVAGVTVSSAGFPLKTPAQPTSGGGADGFVARLNAAGSALVWSTYLGGGDSDSLNGIAVGPGDDVWAVGTTNSTDFPTKNPMQANFAGGGPFSNNHSDGFVARFAAADGAKAWATYLGGTSNDYAYAVAVDSDGNCYVTGATLATDFSGSTGTFPVKDAAQPTFAGSVDNVFTTLGGDAFVSKILPDGSGFVWSTYLGGRFGEEGRGIALDAARNVYVGGTTSTQDAPFSVPTQHFYNPFAAKIVASGASVEWVATIDGSHFDLTSGFALDGNGDAYLVGSTDSTDLSTKTPFQAAIAAGGTDAFVAKVKAGGGGIGPVTAIESFLLPTKIKVKLNAKAPAKSSLVASGTFDLGPNDVDLAAGATLDVGGLHVVAPSLTAKGNKFTFSAEGTSLVIAKAKSGSSRAGFVLKVKGDLSGKVDPEGQLTLRFADAAITGTGIVKLQRGAYALGHVRGTLVAPNLYLAKASAGVPGGGKDSFAVAFGFATDGAVPAASDVTVAFGDGYADTAPMGQFHVDGLKFTYAGGASGITSAKLDYGKEVLAVKAKAIDLGGFAAGPVSVLVAVRLGVDTRALRVRMVHKGKKLVY